MKRSGWVLFSALVLIVGGIIRILDGVWAFSYNGPVVNNLQGAIFGHSLTTYAWLWLIVGVILVGAGIFLIAGRSLAADISRWVGIVAAALVGISTVSWLPYYPVWSSVYIGISVVIIYGLTVHFEEETTPA